MKKNKLFTTLFFFGFAMYTHAQDFVTRAKIEYEKKVKQPKDIYPEFRTSYYDLTFAGNQSLYEPGRAAPATQQMGGRVVIDYYSQRNSTDAIFSNFITGQRINKKSVWDEEFVFEDSIPPIKWKIGQETRVIAGYECRKAVGRIFDSVYVVGFYAEELVIKGGPEGFQGLPGLILGIAIPRYSTTWFATKVELASIDESKITPPTVKGKKGDNNTRLLKKMQQMGVRTDAKDATPPAGRYLKRGYFM